MQLKDRIAFVTGAGQGNGAALAKGLAEAGATVVATDMTEAAAGNTAELVRKAGGKAFAYALDVTDAEACKSVAAEVTKDVGDVSILVNNAGICPRDMLDDPTFWEGWTATMNVNVDGVMQVTHAFLPPLRRTKGVIINIASAAAFIANYGNNVAYPVSKAAVKLLTQGLALQLAKDGVRVNAIAPGIFATPMTAATRADPDRAAAFAKRIPMGRFGESEELVGPAVFLSSSMSSYVTGVTLLVDGGFLAG